MSSESKAGFIIEHTGKGAKYHVVKQIGVAHAQLEIVFTTQDLEEAKQKVNELNEGIKK